MDGVGFQACQADRVRQTFTFKSYHDWDGVDSLSAEEIEKISQIVLRLYKNRHNIGENVKAVVLAGGEGTRLRPLTLMRPKPMLAVGPEPAIHYILSQLSQQGFKEIIMVTGYLGDQIMDYLGDGSRWGLQITYAVKPDEFVCGTAGSLKLVQHLLDDTFIPEGRRGLP
jgi:hypothetical protein